MNASQLQSLILQQAIIPLYYHDDKSVCVERMKSLYKAGARVIEFTSRGKNALENFVAMASTRNELFPDLKLGIGTIFSGVMAAPFLEEGVNFLVSPTFAEELASYANEKSILYIPGCMTPTEIYSASAAGCTIIKIFPAQTLGPTFIKSIKELFPTVHFMPTGGIKLPELKLWYDAGVSAIGIGGPLFTSVSNNLELENKMRQLLQEVALMRNH
jgi:2-dehydro-3-deoxyphosphogluconate aldolase/(4S)-4-hydroxy-2-oxoglutarate aldolase